MGGNVMAHPVCLQHLFLRVTIGRIKVSQALSVKQRMVASFHRQCCLHHHIIIIIGDKRKHLER